ncbi:MAG: hypothetical protein ABJF10_02745 [Chthoniobacter sp.]|uniref:hypothetical protein n=1 Tax=Chthoniobacter sp. TaxID=2510640 RepID=UPI0032A6B781
MNLLHLPVTSERQFELTGVDEEHSEPIGYGHGKIIDNLLDLGHRLRLVTMICLYRRPVGGVGILPTLEMPETSYELPFTEGFFRFQLAEPTIAKLTVFHIHPSFQGQGIGKRKFRQLSDDLEACGVETQFGKPCPIVHLDAIHAMTPKQLIQFYIRAAPLFRDAGDGWIVRDQSRG